ncbi:hypothetical protein [uncultured Jatrophihabitans sp.]|uniref:hypothetical protein n=1 Tax=uncultured Jatrophihabitans sp. TaxID=1610747 RepID=UPI0035C95A1F
MIAGACAAHEHFGYDNSGRMTSVLGQIGPASGPTNALNETVCYAANSTAPSCSTATSNDRNTIQWTKDTVSGETNTYTYDTSNRLTKDVVTGGSNPRTFTYTYDATGNRKTAAVTGSAPSSQSLTFNNGNQISSTCRNLKGRMKGAERPPDHPPDP